MAKLVGRIKGLDQNKLKALEKLLKEFGVSGNVRVTSGLRDHDEVFRIYNSRIRREKLDKIMPEHSKKSKDMINQMILRSDYKGKDSPIDIKYSRTMGINKIKKELENQLKQEGVSDIKAKAISAKVQSIRKDFGGFESSHLKGGKVDVPQAALNDEIVQKLRDKGYNIIKEDRVGIYDIAFPKPGVKGSIRTVGKKRKPSVPFKQAFEEARAEGKREFTWKGKRYNTLKEGESPEEFERSLRPVDLRGPEMQRDQYLEDQVDLEGPEMQRDQYLQDQDDDLTEEIIKIKEEARKAKPEIEPEEMPLDSPEPFGVFARGTPEFQMAEEQEKEKMMMAAEGGEVNPRIPRKKGQPAKSKKHSDLYTDEDPRGTIQGLGFKDVPKAKSSVSKIRKSSRSHAHKVQAAVAMEQRAREMGKTSEAAVYRKFIDQMKERTKKMKKADGGEVESKRFISSLPLETRRKLANEELDEIGFRRIKEARKKRGVEKGFQAGRVLPEEVESIEKKYGVFGEMSDEEQIQGFQTGGEVDDVPEFLRRPPEDRQPEDFRIQDVTEMDVEEPEPEPEPEPMPEPDLSGPEFDRDQYLMEQKSTQELMDTSIPGVGRPPQVNRELARRKREAESGFEVGEGPTLKDIAKQEEPDTMVMRDDVTVKGVKRPPVKEDTRGYFRKLFEESESLRQKDEADLRKREDEILAIVEKPIDPKRLYKKMGTFEKVIALLGLAAGAYDSFKYGGPNVYLEQLNKAVDDDIKEQQLERKEQQYKKAQMLHNAKLLAGRLGRATKDRDKKANFLKLENTFDKAYKKQLRGQNEKVRKIKFIETLNKRGITSREVAYADSIHPDLKVGQKVIKGRDGLYYYTRGDVKKLKEYISDAQDSIDGLAQLEDYVDKVSIFEQIPGASIVSADAAGAQSLRDRLVGKLRIEFFGPGVMTDQEREQAKKILGNPNAFFSRDSVEKEKIRNLLLKINYGIRQKLRRDGLAIPESRNDRMVKAWLKRERKPLTDRNKAIAVNALITAEKKHVRLGGKPGKHWIMDEPLPI